MIKMDFGKALKALKEGKKIRRNSKVLEGDRWVEYFNHFDPVNYSNGVLYIIRGDQPATGRVKFNPSAEDLFATDWEIVSTLPIVIPLNAGKHLNFESALEALKVGMRVRNNAWNGKGMSLIGSRLWSNTEPDSIETPFIIMETADKKLVPWTPSQLDLFSKEWEILD